MTPSTPSSSPAVPAPGPNPTQPPKRRLGMLWLVVAVCAAPIIASYFMYYVVRPEGRTNYGQLINPSLAMPTMVTVSLDGKTSDLAQLKDQWLLVSVAGGACGPACERHLYLQRQMREALGRDKERLDWVWLIPDDAPVPAALTPALQGARDTVHVLRVREAALAGWLKPADGGRLADHLYVVDPMGQWMMRFPKDADPKKMQKDLNKLMRASAFWDKPGR